MTVACAECRPALRFEECNDTLSEVSVVFDDKNGRWTHTIIWTCKAEAKPVVLVARTAI